MALGTIIFDFGPTDQWGQYLTSQSGYAGATEAEMWRGLPWELQTYIRQVFAFPITGSIPQVATFQNRLQLAAVNFTQGVRGTWMTGVGRPQGDSYQANLNGTVGGLQEPQRGYAYKLLAILPTFRLSTPPSVTRPLDETSSKLVKVSIPVADVSRLASAAAAFPELSWADKNYLEEAFAVPWMHLGINERPEVMTWAIQVARIAQQNPSMARSYATQIRYDEERLGRSDHWYMTWALPVIAEIASSGGPPPRIRLYDSRSQEWVTIERPKPITVEQEQAFETVFHRAASLPFEEWLATREPEIADMRARIELGDLTPSEAPELMEGAVKAYEELAQTAINADAEVNELEAQRQLAEDRLAAVRERLILASSDGLGFSLKKLTKAVKKAWDRVVWEPTKAIRDEISHVFLPTELTRFGKRLEDEANRVGRRINREVNRGIDRIATEYGPWIKLVSPFLALIPGAGWLLTIVVSAALAGIEVGYAYRQKRELDKAMRDFKNQVLAEIARLQAETARIEAEAAELERRRLALVELGEEEARARMAVTRMSLDEIARATDRNTWMLMGAVGAAGAALAWRSGRWPLVGLAALLWFMARRGQADPLDSYRLCLEQGEAPELCRSRWIEANVIRKTA